MQQLGGAALLPILHWACALQQSSPTHFSKNVVFTVHFFSLTELSGSILDVSLLYQKEGEKTLTAILTSDVEGHKRITHFQLDNSTLEQSIATL